MSDPFHFLLMQTFNMTNRQMHLLTARLGLDPGQPKILQVLYPDLEKSPKEIAGECRLDKSSATLLIQRMVLKGQLIRKPSKTDRRSILISLSDEGKKLAARVNQIGQQVDEEALGNFADEEKKLLKSMLKKVQKNMEMEEEK